MASRRCARELTVRFFPQRGLRNMMQNLHFWQGVPYFRPKTCLFCHLIIYCNQPTSSGVLFSMTLHFHCCPTLNCPQHIWCEVQLWEAWHRWNSCKFMRQVTKETYDENNEIVTSNITKKTLSTVKSRLRWKYFLSISSEGEARRLNSKSSKHQYQYWSLKNKSGKYYDLKSFRHTASTFVQFGFQLQYVDCVVLELDARLYFSGMIKKYEHWALVIIFIKIHQNMGTRLGLEQSL